MFTVEEIAQKLKPVFEANGVTKAILLGSYARGTATEDSDLDTVVETEPHVRGWDFFGIIEDVRQCLEKEIDMIAKRDIVLDSKIDAEVIRDGVVIYEKKRQSLP